LLRPSSIPAGDGAKHIGTDKEGVVFREKTTYLQVMKGFVVKAAVSAVERIALNYNIKK